MRAATDAVRPNKPASLVSPYAGAVSVMVMVAILLAGCATNETGPVQPAAGEGGLQISSAIPAGMRTLPWSLLHLSGRHLTLSVRKSGCTAPRGVAVDASRRSVIISAYGPSAAGFCTSDEVSVIETLTLAAPVGARRPLLHGH